MALGPRSAPLLERRRETELIASAVERAAAGSGSVVVVEGPAGIGKSSLLGLAIAEAESRESLVLTARGTSLESDLPWGAVLQLLGSLLPTLEPEQREQALAGPAVSALALLEPSRSEAPSPEEQPDVLLLNALHWLVANLTDASPALIAVDDAQWCDELSLRFLDYLAHRIDDLAATIAVGLRTGEPAAERRSLSALRARDETCLISPLPLSRAGVTRFVETRLEGADDEFCDACHEVTAGNPFYLRELLSAAVDGGVDPVAASAERIARLDAEGITRSVLARLGRLGATAGALAAAVAVAGDEVALADAAAIAAISPAEAERAAAELAAAEILAPGEPLDFAHPIVREAVYADIPAIARGRRHLEAARVFSAGGRSPEEVSVQLLQAPAEGSDWVVEALRQAADRAIGRGSPALAARLLERALEEGGSEPDRGLLLRDLGMARATAGDPAGADLLLEGIAAMEDASGRGIAMLQLASLLGLRGRYGDSARVFERAAEEFEDLPEALGGDLRTWAQSGYAVAGSHDPALRSQASRLLHDLAARPEAEATPPGRAALAFRAIDEVYRARPAAEAAALARRALDAELGDQPGESVAFRIAAIAITLCDEIEEGTEAARRLLAWAARHGSVVEQAGGALMEGLLAQRTGRVDELIGSAQASIDSLKLGWGLGLPTSHAALAAGLIDRGELEEADAALEMPGGDDRWEHDLMMPLVPEARGHLRLVQGRTEEAIEELDRAAELLAEREVENPTLTGLSWRTSKALALSALAETDEAAALAGEELDLARRFGVPRAVGMALRTQGQISGGERGIALLQESLETLAAAPSPLEHGRTMVELGAALRRSGKRREARPYLLEGGQIARQCGALALAERAHSELRASGARPRRLVLTGVESLTPSERRVADLAAGGLGNREIAQQLFLTRKTVETHLSRTYSKLAIKSRHELPEALAKPPDA